MGKHSNSGTVERYELAKSPLAQRATQRDVAMLVREKLSDLQTIALPNFKEQFLVRRTIDKNGKKRNLVYPEGRLRSIHERLKYHLSKIVQPPYLMSPRKGKAQRDNAAKHLNSVQFMTLDLKQFYPSTTRSMIRKSLIDLFQMEGDVAGLIAHLATADDRACFGSPLTPVLASIVHRPMFDAIANLCDANKLTYSVWVDDLTISGNEVSGTFIENLRQTISTHGLKSHKLKVFMGNRPVFITGVGVVGSNLIAPNRMELRSKELWAELKAAVTVNERDAAGSKLLTHLGGLRYLVGSTSERGRKIASEMNSIRQKRKRDMARLAKELSAEANGLRKLTNEEQEARKAEISEVAF